METIRIYSWNVNGLRACEKKGFSKWLSQSEGDIIGLQEVRALHEQLPENVIDPKPFSSHFSPAVRRGYSGVGLYTQIPPKTIQIDLGEKSFNEEGRIQIVQFGRLIIANVYFPNGNGKNRDNSRVPFKLAFYRRVFEHAEAARKAGNRVLVMGDFNTAHTEIDLARPKQNRKTSGFLMEERLELDHWMASGWIDTFRVNEKEGGHYTWWSQRAGAREKNVGWRIDYILACPEAMKFFQDAFIKPDVTGSDHCPIGVDMNRMILE